MARACLLLAALVLTAGCHRQAKDDAAAAAFNVEAVTDVPPARPAPPGKAALLPPFDPPVPGTPGALPRDDAPMVAAPFPLDSAPAALDTVQRYYAALEKRDLHNAYGFWDDHGRASGMSEAQFMAAQNAFSEVHANIGRPGRIDAGAGQRYITVPVQPYARDRATAQPRYFIGAVTLHQTMVDGATPDQRRWHIQRIDLRPVTR